MRDEIMLQSLRNNEIAKFCGWSMIENGNSMCIGGMWKGYPPRMQIIGHKESIPDYFNDLNAMHEAEKSLDKDIENIESIRYMYSHYVYNLTPKNQQPFRARCSIRFESFLKAIGKWEIDTNE